MKKPILLCILDGFGFGDENDPNNAIARAQMLNYRRFLKTYPFSKLETSGLAVGLPEGQIGNSEVGHMTIGAGRVIFQDLPRINNAIKSGELARNQDLLVVIADLKKSGKAAHLLGLLSDGGVHSHQNHIAYLADFLAQQNIKVYIHAFLDGRDVAQKSAIKYYNNFLEIVKKNQNIHLATVSGRYYAMDRDKKWDRIKLAYDAIVCAQSLTKSQDFFDVVKKSYAQNLTDEFVKPCVINGYDGMQDGDALIFCNFRADRARQISEALLDPAFKNFATKKINFSHAVAMTQYSEHLNKFYKILFPVQNIKNSLPEILSQHKLKQLHIAETEKYAHVTFFFNCGQEKEFIGEKRILVQSPNVATYDLKPEMSCNEIGENLQKAIISKEFDFIIVNYANPDMVGHSGILQASIKACEAIDKQLGLLEKSVLAVDGVLLISADHGNIECMKDHDGKPHTAHTTNLVPFIFIANDVSGMKLRNGNLSDIAPTILATIGIAQPCDMTGENLISK
ncbi:MAG TPA: 2,3-bisphosphoglycerate-independent phosphoglycerate mutase [Rickettsiales bacterium]|nr:2,3-bisphosphoglycerate-independent phosphoglycerate mutase [Rickettsiales bacterium]